MDQFSVMFGQDHKAIRLDCRTLRYTYAPLRLDDFLFVLLTTGVKHSLASSEYNKRRNECHTGVKILQQYYPEVIALRDAGEDMLREYQLEFPPVVFDRCQYVIQENMRVLFAAEALEKGDFEALGELMFKTHTGLRNQYGVSCDELDFLVDTAKSIDGVLGARMMGGGFGGCTINLLERDKLKVFKETILNTYKTPDGRPPEIIEVEVTEGTSLVK
jgi:galactokinase